MPDPLVSIGLVTWNSAAYLAGSLSALQCQSYRSTELIVVDNASTDESLTIVGEQYPAINVLRNPTNTGFCHAHNQAIRLARGTYYLALNPDIELQPDYISNLVRVLENERRYGTAVGKLLLLPKEEVGYRLDSAGLFIDDRRRQFLRGHGEVDRGQYDIACDVFGADGAAPLYRREMLEDTKIQGEYFDELFFAHKEDVDLAWRSRLSGWACRYEPSAVAYHHRTFRPGRREAISADIRLHAVTNRYFLLAKNETAAGWRRYWPHILWYDLKILVYMCLFERSSLRSVALLWRARSRLMSWRREIAQKTRVPAEEILRWFRRSPNAAS
jgi:GT2 family glycosyltransferase